MTEHQRSGPHLAVRNSMNRVLWPGIPAAVLLGLSVRFAFASLLGETTGDYLGFAATIACITWFLADRDRSTPGVHAALSVLAGAAGMLILSGVRHLPF